VTLPVRAHHVGSLLRPPGLRAAYPLSENDQRRKFALVVDVCNEVWGGP
jgi:hypothetical protein